MISKELLSEVINIKIEDIIDLKMFGKDLKYYEKCLYGFCCDGRLSKHKDSICKSVNIYELAHKCKEWALNKGLIYWYENYKLYIKRMYSCKVDFVIDIGIYNKPFDIDIDFKACQWILDNKKEGN